MRILYVSHSHPPEGEILTNVGGMQRVSQQLVQELERKSSVEVVKETVNVADPGIAIKTTSFLIEKLVELPHIVREEEADVVLFSSMVTASLAYFIKKRVPVPMVTINHGRDVTLPVGVYQWFVPKVFSSLDGVISVSNATREECLKRGMKVEQGVALPNGFELKKLDSVPEKEVSRNFLQEQFCIPKDKYLLLTVGRMVRRKGHAWFLNEVIPLLGQDVVYVVIGDGPQFPLVERTVEESPFKEQIFLLGRQPDEVLRKAYSAADLFIMPNIPVDGDMEGFGIVLLEANMARTPAVASDLEGIKDVITPGKNGYRVPTRNAEQFADKINELIYGNLQQLSKQTRAYVKEQFSWEHVAQEYIDYLQTVISRHKESI